MKNNYTISSSSTRKILQCYILNKIPRKMLNCKSKKMIKLTDFGKTDNTGIILL